MSKRRYRAVVSTRRLNAILQMLLFDKLTQNNICIRTGLGDRQVGKYMVCLEKCHKISWERPATGKQGGAPKVYTLAAGAMPYPELNPKTPPRRTPVEVRQKTGPKPKKQPKAELRTVKTVPAQQVGMHRDPFQALFFGQSRAQAHQPRRRSTMTESQADEFKKRQIALEHAVRTHEHSVDENLIVKAAQVYLAFLNGNESSTAPGEVMHHPV